MKSGNRGEFMSSKYNVDIGGFLNTRMGIKKWIPLVLITAVVLTVTWMTMMYIVALYILFGGGI